MIGEIFITRILIVSLIIYIISSYNSKDLVQYYNKKINSKNKEIVKYAKKQKKIIILSLWLFSITSVFVLIHVSHKVFYKLHCVTILMAHYVQVTCRIKSYCMTAK